MKMTLHILRNMKQTELANKLQSKLAPSCHRNLKSKLRDKCQRINEGISTHGTSTFLNEIYTDLYITEGESGEVNNEHEVKQIEMSFRKLAAERKLAETTTIKLNDIFKSLPEQEKSIRTVLTKGVAGIGKTVSVQKFILEWCEEKENQDVLFIFPLPFRELNLMKEKKLSLVDLLNCFFPETRELTPTHYTYYKLLFIFDGLDECRLPLDFQKNEGLWDVMESTSVDVLLTNLIKGNLLPSALLWITSRPAAAHQIPPEYVDQVTEVRGFSDPQKDEYFRKRISDQSLANRIITHIKSLRSLYIMCHIPAFCWIAASVLERMLDKAEIAEIPKTLTQMFTNYLIFQINQKGQKLQGRSDIDLRKTKDSILALGKLAFQQLGKGNLIFYETDLKECGIDIRDASVYSGVCTQINRAECGLHLEKAFSFMHLSFQEFLAALYAFIEFSFNNRNVLEYQNSGHFWFFKFFSRSTMSDFLNGAVDKALQSQNGHLDLFLRFLLGLSLESNQILLQGLLTQRERTYDSKEETVKYIHKKIVEYASPEKSINLFHCLNELNDQSLVPKVQEYLRRRDDDHAFGTRLSPAQWSAVGFWLLNSEEELDEFVLRTYQPSEECLLRLLPVVEASRKAILASCNLGEKSCQNLGSALQQAKSLLRDLDLSNNDLQDSGVKLLSDGLKSSHCKLEILRLSGCLVTEEGCSYLASALSSNPLHLKELDLTYNHPGDAGAKLLSARLKDPHCKLEILKMEHAGKNRIKPGLRKYACELTLDPNTAHTRLFLSKKNKKVSSVWNQQSNSDRPERFDVFKQVLCRESLHGCCYWEAEWTGREGVSIAVAYKGISRKGHSDDCRFGFNEKSWTLNCCNDCNIFVHNKKETSIPVCSFHSKRVGVFLDWSAGILSFYSVCSQTHTLTHLYTLQTIFTEPLYAGFKVKAEESSVCLCEIE